MTRYPIVILPGWLLSSDRYEKLAALLEEDGYETFIVDFPGFVKGKPLTKVFELSDYVKFLDKFLKARHISKAIFLCHSFGGRVALKFISQEPKKAAAIILSGTPGFPGIGKFRKKLFRLFSKLGKLITSIPPVFLFRPLFKKLLYKSTGSSDYQKLQGIIKLTFEKIVDESLAEYMSKIRVPTLLLWGKQDKLVPVRIAEKMHKTIRDSRLVIVENQGHMFAYRESELVKNHVLKFLENIL